MAAIHGPVSDAASPNLSSSDQGALFERLEQDPAGALLLDGPGRVVPGRVRGPLIGGNLEVFSRLLGTPYLPDVQRRDLVSRGPGRAPLWGRPVDHPPGPGRPVQRGGRRGAGGLFELPRARADARRDPDRGRSLGRTPGPLAHPGRRPAGASATAPATGRWSPAPWPSWTPRRHAGDAGRRRQLIIGLAAYPVRPGPAPRCGRSAPRTGARCAPAREAGAWCAAATR